MGPPTDHALAVSAPASGSTSAEFLRDLGRTGQALAADERALTLTANPAERSLPRQRLNWT